MHMHIMMTFQAAATPVSLIGHVGLCVTNTHPSAGILHKPNVGHFASLRKANKGVGPLKKLEEHGRSEVDSQPRKVITKRNYNGSVHVPKKGKFSLQNLAKHISTGSNDSHSLSSLN